MFENDELMAGRVVSCLVEVSPLPWPSGFGRRDVVEYLLQNGANVHARDDGGLISLHNACSFGHAEVVSLLLHHGADANSKDNWNYTPLHEAAIKGKIDVCIGESILDGLCGSALNLWKFIHLLQSNLLSAGLIRNQMFFLFECYCNECI